MSANISLRPATIRDTDLLLEWRNDPETRKASHNTTEVQRDEHILWLSRTLNDSSRRLYVAEESGVPVGTVRADLSDRVWELSWTVSPGARGRGVAKMMVAVLARQISEPIRAEIKAGNIASTRIAEYVGMEFQRERERERRMVSFIIGEQVVNEICYSLRYQHVSVARPSDI